MPVFGWIIATSVLILLFVLIPRVLYLMGKEEMTGVDPGMRGYNFCFGAMSAIVIIVTVCLFLWAALTPGQ
jgi:cell division protein FtsW (lipid II flippase)